MKMGEMISALRHHLDNINVGIIHFSNEDQCVWANKSARAILGQDWDIDQLTLSDFLKYVFDHSLEWGGANSLLEEQHSEQGQAFHDIIIAMDGRAYIVKVHYKGGQGAIAELSDVTLVKDYTERLAKMHRHNTLLVEAINSSSKGIVVADMRDAHKKILFTNSAMKSLLPPHSNDDAQEGDPLSDFLATHFPNAAKDWERVLSNGGRMIGSTHYQNKAGQDVCIEINLSSYGSDGQGDYVIGFVSDVTQARSQEMRLRQTGKLEAIGQLAGGIAHDFNNVLSIIDGFARLADAALKRGDSNIGSALDKIRAAASRGSGLTKQLLLFGKHRVTDDQTIELGRQINDIKGLLAPLIGPTIMLQVDAADIPFYVRGTSDNISQIVMNLALNARDAMPDGGDLIIGLKSYPKDDIDGVLLSVSDTGSGIPDDIREKIFDPFFTTKPQGKGTGLGLSMVYALTEKMAGDISLHSEMGLGTSFNLWFPCCEGCSVDEDTDVPHGEISLAHKSVLVVDDEAELLEIMSMVLEGFGMKVLRAANGTQALQVQDECDDKIDFLLTDMVMPELGGVKLAQLMHEVRPETRILFMSGYPVRGDLSEIKLDEEAIFMTKPINPEKLKAVMQQILLNANSGEKLAMPRWTTSS